MRRGTTITEAGIRDVLQKIVRRVRDDDTAKRLVEKIKTYLKTKSDRDDISLQESAFIYGPYDYGDKLPLSKKRDVDIDWSNHAEYRSDLRDVDPERVNEQIRDWLKERLQKKGPDSKDVRMKLPEGTAVVKYDLTQKPADADVITVWGSANPYLNTSPTELKRMIEREDNPARKRDMKDALSAWRLTVPGPFRRGSSVTAAPKVEKTKPGSKHKFKVTYPSGQVEYTDKPPAAKEPAKEKPTEAPQEQDAPKKEAPKEEAPTKGIKNITKTVTKGIKRWSEKSKVKDDFTSQLITDGKKEDEDFEGQWGDGEGSVAVTGKNLDVQYTDENDDFKQEKVNLENPDENPEQVKEALRNHGLWDKVVEVSQKLQEVNKKHASERIAEISSHIASDRFFERYRLSSLEDEAVAFEQMAGTPEFLKVCGSAICRMLVKKGVCSRDELRAYLEGELRSRTASRRIVGNLLERVPKEFCNLWYENEAGEKWEPDYSKNGFDEPPEGFKYQISRFPSQLREGMLKIVQADEVAKCDHPDEHVAATGGWVDGVEGRECNACGGTQMRNTGQEWPEKWEAYGSRSLGAMEMGWSEDLALGLVDKGFTLGNAIIVAATSCERCMNTLAYECGLDWGYQEGSEDWEKCGTSCRFCKPNGE